MQYVVGGNRDYGVVFVSLVELTVCLFVHNGNMGSCYAQDGKGEGRTAEREARKHSRHLDEQMHNC